MNVQVMRGFVEDGKLVTVDARTSRRGRLLFRFLTGDCDWQKYGGSFASKRLFNGDWHYWLVISVCEASDSDHGYFVSLHAVSPEAAEGELQRAYDCMGVGDDHGEYMDTKATPNDSELALVETLLTYGVAANLGCWSGTNIKKLMRQARNEAQAVSSLFGFYMDRPENRLGDDGWAFISGNRCTSRPSDKREVITPWVKKILERLKKITKEKTRD